MSGKKTQPREPTVIELWVAREMCEAYELLLIGQGDLDAARSRITASYRSRSTGVWVEGGKVHYSHPSARPPQSHITVRRVVEVASGLGTDAKHQAIRAGYRRYLLGVDATKRDHYGHRELTSEQRAHADAAFEVYRAGSNALSAAARAWWRLAADGSFTSAPDDPFAAACDALIAAEGKTEVAKVAKTYADVWAPEHEALAQLRRAELSNAPTPSIIDTGGTLEVYLDRHDSRGPQLILSTPTHAGAQVPEARERGYTEAVERAYAEIAPHTDERPRVVYRPYRPRARRASRAWAPCWDDSSEIGGIRTPELTGSVL